MAPTADGAEESLVDADRFDALTRLLSAVGSRRTLTRGGAGFAALLAGAGNAVAGRCGPCERKTRRGCKARKDNTICRSNGCCRSGRCFGPPTCARLDTDCSADPSICCGGAEKCQDIGAGPRCRPGGRGSRCFGDQDCAGERICVGYRCQ